jgi:hypothetical protein
MIKTGKKPLDFLKMQIKFPNGNFKLSKTKVMKDFKGLGLLSKLALSLGLCAIASTHQLQAVSVFYVSSIGQSANTNIYGTTLDTSGNVTSWGTHYTDIAFRLEAANPGTSLTSFAVWVSANKGNSADSSGNVLRSTWFAGPIDSNANYASRLGTASINSSALTSTFADFMIGATDFDSPVGIPITGTDFFVRIWAIGANSNAGFGVKVADNATLQYASPDSPITMYNWTGSSYSATPATTNLSLLPEPSAFSLLAVGLGGLAMIRRRRS